MLDDLQKREAKGWTVHRQGPEGRAMWMLRPRAWSIATLATIALVALFPSAVLAQDSDADGVPDSTDNCTNVPNRLQIDTDCDGYGNACDFDFDQDQIVGTADFVRVRDQVGFADLLTDVAPPFDGVPNAADEQAVFDAINFVVGPGAGPASSSPSCENRTLQGSPYCVVGWSFAKWSWELSGASITTVSVDPTSSSLSEASARVAMMMLQSSIDSVSATSGVSVTDVSLYPTACFTLSDPNAVLKVGPEGAPADCTVTQAGCSPSPRLYLQSDPALQLLEPAVTTGAAPVVENASGTIRIHQPRFGAVPDAFVVPEPSAAVGLAAGGVWLGCLAATRHRRRLVSSDLVGTEPREKR